jgi:hypothetical protein
VARKYGHQSSLDKVALIHLQRDLSGYTSFFAQRPSQAASNHTDASRIRVFSPVMLHFGGRSEESGQEQRLAQWWRNFEDLRQAGFYGNQTGESEVQEALDLLGRIRAWATT